MPGLALMAMVGAHWARGGAGIAASRSIAHVLRIVEPQDIVTLNPHLYAATSLSMISELTMAYLVRYDHRGHPIPELATEIPSKENGGVSADGRTIMFHLRPNARWSDGVPFTVDDVIFSIGVVKNPANDEISRDGWDLIDAVKAIGPSTVMIHLRQPYSEFLPTFFGTAGANPCLLPKHILGGLSTINAAKYNDLPVGIGPFRYSKWQRGVGVTLVANPYYFRGQPLLKRIEFATAVSEASALSQMQSGAADLWPLVRPGRYPEVKKIRTAVTQIIPGSYFSHLAFDMHSPIFVDRRVREALRLGTDRERIRRDLRHNTGSLQEGFAAPGTPAYDVDLPFHPYDPDAANALLDQAGWRRGSDGRRRKATQLLQFTAVVASDPDTKALLDMLRSMWRRLGITLNVRRVNSTLLFETRQQGGVLANGHFDITEFAWQSDVQGDLSNLFGCSSAPPRGQNYGGYCNPRVDALFGKMKNDYNLEHRKQILAVIQSMISDDVPIIVLAVNDDIYTASGSVHNFHPNAFSPFDDMMDVDVY